MSANNFCGDCGARLVPDAKFCGGCGSKIANDESNSKPTNKASKSADHDFHPEDSLMNEVKTHIKPVYGSKYDASQDCENCGSKVGSNLKCKVCGFEYELA